MIILEKRLSKSWLFHLLVLFLAIDVFIYPSISDFVSIFLLLFWFFLIWKFKLKASASFVMGLASFLFSFLAHFFGQDIIKEKSISWAFIFTIVAIVQKFLNKEPS